MFAAAQDDDVNVDPDSEVSQEKDTVSSALEAIVRAAWEGNATAQNGMGVFERELGGDPLEAIKWFRKAADQGHASAQFNLGVMYIKGKGVIQDYMMAHMYTNLAASNGLENADHIRDTLATIMTPDQIGKAQQMAREWTDTHPRQ